MIHTHKVWARTCISGNEIAYTLANERTLKEKPNTTPHIHIAHPTPYWLASCPTATHYVAICNLRTFITKTHENHKTELAKRQFPYVDKRLSKNQINQKLSYHFWKNVNVLDIQITQTLKFVQYMGNHRKFILAPQIPEPQLHFVITTIETRGITYYQHMNIRN